MARINKIDSILDVIDFNMIQASNKLYTCIHKIHYYISIKNHVKKIIKIRENKNVIDNL